MLKLYLVRHGETAWNIDNKYQGITDIPLNEIGIKQAQAIARRMKAFKIDKIYSSDLSRAYETGKLISREKNINIEKMPGLREISFGEWEGYTISELEELYGENYKRFFLEPHKYNFPGEGSMEAVQKRIRKAIGEIEKKHPKGDIVIVSHGGVLKILIMTLLEIDLSFFKSFWLGNTSLSIIEKKDNGKWILSLLNDRSHLEEVYFKQ
ncbi:MAG: histidine phosphatase family protein [Epulopiscium sp.]|jgi:broad specificity phosphatase PhoE|nr:histidine phosphatase family protein [Candidatus Epulonipiscium sp.]